MSLGEFTEVLNTTDIEEDEDVDVPVSNYVKARLRVLKALQVFFLPFVQLYFVCLFFFLSICYKQTKNY